MTIVSGLNSLIVPALVVVVTVVCPMALPARAMAMVSEAKMLRVCVFISSFLRLVMGLLSDSLIVTGGKDGRVRPAFPCQCATRLPLPSRRRGSRIPLPEKHLVDENPRDEDDSDK